MNATNVTRNGTKHAEYMALAALLSHRPEGVPDDINEKRTLGTSAVLRNGGEMPKPETHELTPDELYARQGHLYPYGQKLHRAPRVHRSIVRECTLYVTVEPCVMCASLLRQLGIRKVFFGAVNDKFGGTGGVFSIHRNSDATSSETGNPRRSSVPIVPPLAENGASHSPRPGGFAVPRRGSASGNGDEDGCGDGGNVEPGYEVEGGWGREEAVGLLRRFYVQENGRGKALRAAREYHS